MPAEEDVKVLRVERAQLKGMITRHESFASIPINLTSSIELLQARRDKLVANMNDYERVQREILSIDPDDKEDVELVENKYFRVIALLDKALKTSATTSQPAKSSSEGECPSKLPNIDIPVFSGRDFTKYMPFMDLFTAVFHRNKSISDVQKLFYLRKYLSDDALAVIINLPLVNDSYQEALTLLKRRYENKARLICNHINLILELPAMQRGTAACIRSLITEVQQQIHALKNLGQPIEHWDMLLMCILTKKLDQFTNRAFQLERDASALPTMAEFLNFLERRAMALEDSGDKSAHESPLHKKPFKVTNVATKAASSRTCKFCDNTGHSLYDCPQFKLAPTNDRLNFVANKKLCKTCLNDHNGRCRFYFKCKICKLGHNTLLHSDGNADPVQTIALHANSSSTQVLLPTVKVKVYDSRGHHLFVRALLDSGSQASFITSSLMKKLSLAPKNKATNIVGIGNNKNKINQCVNIEIHSPVQNVQLEVTCNVVDSITTQLPQQQFDISNYQIPEWVHMSDDQFNKPEEISLLLGADVYFNILLEGQVKLVNGPVLQNTLFGYVAAGTVASPPKKTEDLVTNLAICDSNKLETVMEQFWLSESLPESPSQDCSEFQKAESIFQETVAIKDNTFCVEMPLVTDLDNLHLGDSFSAALQRFLALERKFKKDPSYFNLYKKFIDEYMELGHAKKVDVSDYDIHNGPVYFLSHHAVLNPSSKTTKLRVVYNGSMKTKNKTSLNDVMLNGPIVQSDLFDILIMFRTYLFTLMCDVTKMFRAVYISERQTSLQNILWRDNPANPILCLQLQTVTYGLKASTYLATRCLIELAERYGDTYPLAAKAMHQNTYVDDVLCGSDDIQQLSEIKSQLIELLKKGNFKLHKWCSNVPAVLDDLPDEQKYFDKIDINQSNIVKTLGLKYDIIPDSFTFSSPTYNENEIPTKRKVLSYIGKMFDPLGLVGPIIVTAKLFMQELWSAEIGWDSILPQTQLECWQKFRSGLDRMGELTVPRGISCKDIKLVELVGYADASIKAFGCSLYLRIVDQSGAVRVNLLCSKSRLAPLKNKHTIPKLELNSALLLATLSARVYKTLNQRFPLAVFLYSDSKIVLAWLQSHKTIRDPYVCRRVKEIHDLTDQFNWSHVRSGDNPADLLSRGCQPLTLKSSSLWWHGPSYLTNVDFVHSSPVIEFPIPPYEEEIIANVCTDMDYTFYENYSNLNKMQRIVALLLRFKNNSLSKNQKLHGPLSPKELTDSLNAIIRAAQNKHFSNEIASLNKDKPIKSGIANLHPFLDNTGLLRVGGRLQNAINMPYEKMHPPIIPKSSHLAKLLVEREHLRLLHAGPKLVLSSLSQRFHLVSGISEVKKVVCRCVKCHRLKAAAAKQLMGSLPKERITADRPFQTVGVDFCGPFSIKVARIRRALETKSYVAVFVCFITKAVHVELVTDLTTEAFLACLKRFISRRGLPTQIFCDNAKTFKGASNTLKELYDLFNSKNHRDVVTNFCSEKYIQFKFIPSYAPEFGGIWEAAVKSLKFHLKRVVSTANLTFEALYTVLTEIEAILNSRPLLPLSSDVNDTNYLTPGHFLIGAAMTSFPEVDLTNENTNRLKFWTTLSKLKQDFWKAWSRDYLTQLQSRPKWINEHPNLKVGDLVIVRSDNTAPYQWPMARILKIFPGPDNRVRVAEVKIGNKTYLRSYRKLSPLPIN